MSRGARRFLPLCLSLVAALVICNVTDVQAAEVSLTSGSVIVNCPGQPFSGGNVDLAGDAFQLRFGFGSPPPTACAPAPVRILASTFPASFDFASGFAIYQGVGTSLMRGVVSFDSTSITGFVEAFDNTSNFGAPIFSVNFIGSGTGVITTTQSTFNVNAVPEPATLILLGTGAALFGGARRWRKARKRRDSGAELQGE
jgi:hypothetical protein